MAERINPLGRVAERSSDAAGSRPVVPSGTLGFKLIGVPLPPHENPNPGAIKNAQEKKLSWPDFQRLKDEFST